MKHLTACAGALLLLFAGQAAADRGAFYVEGKFGGSRGDSGTLEIPLFTLSPNHFIESVYVWGGAIGYTYKPWAVPLRMEAEYLYRNHYPFESTLTGDGIPLHTTFQSHTNSQTILANAYFDIPLSRMFAVFLGGGIGGAINTTYSKAVIPTIGTFTDTDDNADLGWMGSAGFSVIPVPWLFLSLSYRYSGLGDISAKTGTTLSGDDFAAQEILLGIRVMIPDLYPGASKPRAAPSYTLDK